MNECYLELVQRLMRWWKLKRSPATLLATAIFSVARHRDNVTTAKAMGVLMALHAAELIGDDQYHEGHRLVSRIAESRDELAGAKAAVKHFESYYQKGVYNA